MILNFLKTRHFIFLTAILIFVAAFSFSHLTTRPSLWYDEGLNIEIAHNFLLYGKLDVSTAPGVFSGAPYIVGTNGYPLTMPLAGVFSVFGFGLKQTRIYTLFWLLVVLLSVYYIMKSIFGADKALITVAFIATFTSFYGNGLTATGEIPGFFFLIWGLFFLIKPERPNYLLTGLLFTLAAAAKPSIYLLLFPAFLIFMLLEERKKIFRKIFKFILGTILPVLLWIILAFPNPLSPNTWKNVILFYRYPFGQEFSISAHILKNIGLIFTHLTLMYFLLLAFIIIFWFFANGRANIIKRKFCIFFFIYAVFAFLYFLKSPGWLRYIFAFELLAFIFAPSALETVTKEIFKGEKFQNLAFKFALTIFLIAQLGYLFFFWTALYSPYPEITTSFINENLAKNDTYKVGILNSPAIASLINPLKKFQIIKVGESPVFGENPLSFPEKSLPRFIVTFAGDNAFIKGYENVLENNYFLLRKIECFSVYELK
jgi:4-amino-4-deoxy-L-arabinose transferase-like glycosyltransferase